MASEEPTLTTAQRIRIDELARAVGCAPIVSGPLVEQALASIGATGGVLLHMGEEFDSEYVVILAQGATVPVAVSIGEGTISIRIST